MGCPMCGSLRWYPLGVLGRLRWFMCRDCGCEYNEEINNDDDE